MCNHHLQDRKLSLKAKGLLSQILSLPEDWDYTLRGLAAINKESVNTIGNIVNELIEAGYIIREQSRGSYGKFANTEYVIFELPQSRGEEETEPYCDVENADGDEKSLENTGTSPCHKNCDTVKREKDTEIFCDVKDADGDEKNLEDTGVSPCHKKRDTVKRDTDSCDANKIRNNKVLNNKIRNIEECHNQSDQSGYFYHAMQKSSKKQQEDEYEIYRGIIHENINYDALLADYPDKVKQIDGMVNIILDVVTSKKDTIWIAKEEKSQSVVKSKFLKLDKSNIDYVLYCLGNNTTQVQDMMAYMRTALYNAPDTEQVYWQNRAMSKLYGGRGGPAETP